MGVKYRGMFLTFVRNGEFDSRNTPKYLLTVHCWLDLCTAYKGDYMCGCRDACYLDDYKGDNM